MTKRGDIGNIVQNASGLMEYPRIPSVYNIISCISLIQLKLANNCFHEI